MTRKVYTLVFDGLADWEPALFLCEMAEHEAYELVTVGFDSEPVRTLGGFRVVPDVTLAEVSADDAAVFVVPGGARWETSSSYELIGRLREFHSKGIPIGGICGATVELARAGLLDDVAHTSNSPEVLAERVPSYRGAAHYVRALAASGGRIVTAPGTGYAEFAVELLRELDVMTDDELVAWYRMVKPNGVAAGA